MFKKVRLLFSSRLLLVAFSLIFQLSVAAASEQVPTIYIAGDSTASNGADRGWGSHLRKYVDAAKAKVVNRARGGRSSRTFRTEGLWEAVRSELRAGDFVLIQFGHNDGGSLTEGRGRGSLRGIGEEIEDIVNKAGDPETVHTYGWYLRRYVEETRAAGAHPVLLSLTVRNIWKDGRVERGSGSYREWAMEVAESGNVPFLDLTMRAADHYEELGEERVKDFFPEDYAHTSPEGADLNARLVAGGLADLAWHPFAGIITREAARVTEPLRPLPVPANPVLPSLILIGDSTVRNGRGDGGNGQWGWGDPFIDHFRSSRINIANRAVGGLSSRTYITKGYWAATLKLIKPGDFVMMQFGHNDAAPLNDDRRARGTIRGVGEETEEIENMLTGRHEIVHTYGWYLRKYVADIRAAGATPIICSPVPRKVWVDGALRRGESGYAEWAGAVARAEGVAFVDLNSLIADRYDELGPDQVDHLFADERVHTSLEGARLNAEVAVAALKADPGVPLAGFFAVE